MPRQDRLPPMQALSMFESAARLASFTAAARELGSTQPAVSQRVVQLEEALGVPLFERGHRGVTLTEDGARLFEAVRQGLDIIRTATGEIRARNAQRTLTLLTDFGFATYWLMPRLPQFKALMPDVDVKIVTSQNVSDADGEPADVVIAFGSSRAQWSSPHAIRLFPESVVPVCSPALVARNKPSSAADLLDLPLLHLQATLPERWLSWAGWFEAHGLSAPPAQGGFTFNSYALVTHAAVMGQGVALGWAPLVDDLIAKGHLIALDDTPLVTDRGYVLVTQREPSAVVRAFSNWLLDECDVIA
ncbi:LysR substrate-binding domain-containing protein [Caballeronia sp. LP006]|uniref:choline sulfate utilization transcriptional regulator n=1 Tax=unclassified Caballeronia TaxID=2646786 RepID=UPI001FD1051F|nr:MULTISPECIES: LysR substrate-binding domain-containing protein [unclassified Caballeronia]MDR5776115.1 LysR substrate-binding domain-containing protein [Caballeronia sp. LZ002]MDR5829220.1 LysR substrate-binding domain-containing protein [Caballeronia sp. LP006]MDR5851555.1 LysR substrate-binding domain-containing protein [Caballeronia sp. LZ003]